MSFFEDDAPGTVEAALAFIDELEDSASTRSPGVSDSTDAANSTSDADAVARPSGRQHAPAKPTSAGRKRVRRGYTTQLQRRKKAEVVELREQVDELEDQLSHLQHTRRRLASSVHARSPAEAGHSSSLSTGDAVSQDQEEWRGTATFEFLERRRSEITNKKLRAAVAEQRALNESLLAVLDKTPANLVCENPRHLVKGSANFYLHLIDQRRGTDHAATVSESGGYSRHHFAHG